MLPLYKTPLHVFNYDEIPAGYYYRVMHHGKAPQRFWHREKFLAVARHIRDGERVLDLGCGPGSFLSILGDTRPNVRALGLDIASPQVEFASKTVAPRFKGRIGFQVHDVENPRLPFDDATFDVVTSIEVIEHIHPFIAHRALSEARRLLKPGGRLIVTTPNYRSLWPLIELALEKMSPVKYHDQHINKFTPNSFVKFLESVGLHVAQLETLFMLAPFTAGLSLDFAQALYRMERSSGLRTGSLLLAVAEVNRSLFLPEAKRS